MNKTLSLSLAVGAASLYAMAAQAQDLNYNYVEVAYVSSDIDDPNVDGDGLALGGSVSLAENYHVFAGYSSLEYDFSIDATTWNVGIGYNRAIAKGVDVVATLSYVDAELDVPIFGSFDDDGYGIGLGLRGMVTGQLELAGGLQYVDLDESGSDTAVVASVGYYFTKSFQVGGGISFADDSNAYNAGVRFYFDR